MQYSVDGDVVFIRIDKDEDLFANILQVAQSEGFEAAHISGIGALRDVELGYYRLDKKDYDRAVYSDVVELLSLEGNLSLKDGQRFLHLHAVLGNANFQCFGGHLFKATVGVTCEINCRIYKTAASRELNPQIGLAHLNLCAIDASN